MKKFGVLVLCLMLSSGAIAGDTNEVVMDEKIESTAVASDGIILPFFLLLLLIIAGAA